MITGECGILLSNARRFGAWNGRTHGLQPRGSSNGVLVLLLMLDPVGPICTSEGRTNANALRTEERCGS